MIFKGSLNYTPSGRKRNGTTKRGRNSRVFRDLQPSRKRREGTEYLSAPIRACETTKRRVYAEHTKTVAIAYNKGPYQVIPESEIKYIGK